jgi:trimeric autotransporter adhesin
MKRHLLIMLLISQLATVTKIYAQNIAINGTGSLPDTSAMLDVSSVNKGFLAPRMTTVQQNAIPLPAKGLLIYNTTDNGFKVNTGTPASPSWIALAAGSGTITHALSYANNVLTNTINGVGSSVNIINAVSNSSANNVLSTTVNGISGSGVPIINSISNTSSANSLLTRVNGVSGANVPIINSNALSLSGTNLTSTVNGVASAALNLSSLVSSATTNTLASTTNTMTNTTNGVSATAPIVNTVSNTSATNTLTTRVNGVAASGVNIINNNTLTSAANTITSNINGITSAAPAVNTNALSLNGSTLISTVNGVASGGLNLAPIVAAGTTNTLTSSTNTMTNTTNGVAANAPIVNSNVLAINGTNITSTVNGVVSNSLNIGAASTEPWYNVATNSAATSNTQNIYQSANVGIGVTNPGTQLVVKDNIEIRREGTVAQLLFSNTAGTGDFRFGGDGGDIYWQGGGGRSLQMGSYWATILGGDRQTAAFPSFANGITGTSVIVAAMRNESVALAVQANSSSQSANLTEWRNSGGTALSAVDEKGNLGLGTAAPNSTLHTNGSFSTAVASVSSNTTLTEANSLVLVNAGGSDRTITLPTASGITGRIYTIKKVDSGSKKVVVDGRNSETIDGAATFNLTSQWDYVTIQSDGSNWMIIGQN